MNRTPPKASGPSFEDRRVKPENRPVPEPLDDEALELLSKLWMLTRKRDVDIENKDAIMNHWIVETLGSKMSLFVTKRALRYLIKTEEWWPAPVKFEYQYNTIREQEGL